MSIIVKVRKQKQTPLTVAHNRRTAAEKQVMRKKALQLLVRGASLMQISQELGVSTKTVGRYIDRAIATYLPKRKVEQARAIALEAVSLREMRTNMRIQRADITDADYARLDLALTRAAEHRAKLEGTHAPQEHKLDVTVAPAAVRSMADDDLKRITAGDFGPVYGQPMNGGKAS